MSKGESHQVGLVDYTESTGVPTDVRYEIRQCQRPSESVLPEIEGFSWITAKRDYPLVSEWGLFEHTFNEDREQVLSSAVGITNGIGRYLDEYAVKEIPIPSTYSAMDSYSPEVLKWTADGGRRGLGIQRYQVELGVRLVNGIGHYDAGEIHFIYCSNGTVVIAGPRGVFIDDLAPLSFSTARKPSPPPEVYTEIQGMEIPEEDSRLQRGLAKFIEIVNEFSERTIEEYDKFDGRHWFVTNTGEPLYVTGSTLSRVESVAQSCSEMEQSYTHRFGDQTYTVEWTPEDSAYEFGDDYDSVLYDGTVIGFEFDWERREYVYSGGIHTLAAVKQHLIFSERDSERYNYVDYQIETKTDELETVDVRGD